MESAWGVTGDENTMKPYWTDGDRTIYCGDALEILPHLSGVDLVVTDPPYNLGKDYGPEVDDSRPPEDYWIWFGTVFKAIFEIMDVGYLYTSHSDKGVYLAKPLLETLGFDYIQTLIWWGRNGYSMQLSRHSWSFRHESILFMQKGVPRDLEVGEPGMRYTSVIEVPRPQSNFPEGRYHPTQKPVGLYKAILQRTPGDLLVDPFMGVGTSLRAAAAVGKRAIGIDKRREYCEIAVQLLQGKLPKRISQLVMALSTEVEE